MPPAESIPPRTPEEATGTTVLPQSRIKKIMKLDDDFNGCSASATFLVTVATEMFIQYLTEHGQKMALAEPKPRKTLQYKDLSNAVSRFPTLEFLTDVIPTGVATKQPREKKTAKPKPKSKAASSGAEAGQTTLDGKWVVPAVAEGEMEGVEEMEGAGEPGESEEKDETDASEMSADDDPEDTGVARRGSRDGDGAGKGKGKGKEAMPADESEDDVDMG